MLPLDRAYGLCRSLWIYYGRPGGAAALDRLYRPFVPAGGLCFDIGAHVGNRTRSWSRLGARVIAVEPQGDFARFLRWLFRADPRVTILELAVAERAGTIRMQVSSRTPTVSTGSERFIAAAARVPSFAWVRWDTIIDVPATTLDELIARATACPISSRSTSKAWSTRSWLASPDRSRSCRSSSCPWPRPVR